MMGPLDDLVRRIERRIEAFQAEHAVEQVSVDVELHDGSLHRLASISAEPGYGFVTLCPHCDTGEPRELIVPLGSLVRITLGRAEPEQQLGFSLPAEGA